MSCPIVIKTIDSLEKKGIYEHDTSRVLNKPAFIAYNDKWSQIAKDKFNLTNVDKMFNIVDGGLKKMLSGSSYLRDNTESITRAFVNQDFFNELQEKYDLANKPADTTINRIKQVNNKQKIEVKPGVQELFESNPELANAAYEAVGVDVFQLKEDVDVTNAFLTARQHEEAKRINSGEFDDTKLDLKTELQNIIDNSTNPLLVELAKSIQNKESLKTIKAYSTQKPFKTKEGFEPAAAYQAETQRLVLFLGNTARFENKEREYQYLLHELVHHFVDRELVLTNSKQAENIRQLFKYTKYQLTKAGKENLYGLTNFHEFVTEALTNPDFQKELKSLQVPNQFLTKSFSIFDYFLELISKVLGTNKSVLEAVVSQAADIFELQEYKKSLSITPQQKQQALQIYSQYLESLNKPNTNPILQTNQQEQVKKFVELQERLNNKEFIEGAKNAYENSEKLKSFGTQEQYNDYIARVSLGIIKNPSSGDYNYNSKVKDIVYHYNSSDKKFDKFDKQFIGTQSLGSQDSEQGFSFVDNKLVARAYGSFNTEIYSLPKEVWSTLDENIYNRYDKNIITAIVNPQKNDWKSNQDGWSEIMIKNVNNIHILGSKQDIEGFKEFVNKPVFDKELVQKIQDKLQKLYPEIKLNITNNPIWEKDDNVFNQLIEDDYFEGNSIKYQNEIEKISNLILNKLKFKLKEFNGKYDESITTLDEYKTKILNDLLKNIGINGVTSLSQLKDRLNSTELQTYLKEELQTAKTKKQKYAEQLEVFYSTRRLLNNFLKHFDINKYNNEQQAVIKSHLLSLFKENKFKSDKQAVAFSKKQINSIEWANKKFQLDKISIFFLGQNAKINKIETLINYFKIDKQDAVERIYTVVENELNRREKFFNSEKTQVKINAKIAEDKIKKDNEKAERLRRQNEEINKYKNSTVVQEVEGFLGGRNIHDLEDVLESSNINVELAVIKNNGYSLDKTPEGKESNLYKAILNLPEVNGNEEIAAKLKSLIYSNDFTNWFGDWLNNPEESSKIVDENGEPKLVYHGSGREFNNFEEKERGSTTGKWKDRLSDSEMSFMFTDSPNTAFYYAIIERQQILKEILYYVRRAAQEPSTQMIQEMYQKYPAIKNWVEGLKQKDLTKGEILQEFKRIYNEYSKIRDLSEEGAIGNPQANNENTKQIIDYLEKNKDSILKRGIPKNDKYNTAIIPGSEKNGYPIWLWSSKEYNTITIRNDGILNSFETKSLNGKNIKELSPSEYDLMVEEFKNNFVYNYKKIQDELQAGGFRPKVYPVFLNAKNVNSKDFKNRPFVFQQGDTDEVVKRRESIGAAFEVADLIENALKDNLDGSIIENIADPTVSTNYAVFRSNQIKSVFNKKDYTSNDSFYNQIVNGNIVGQANIKAGTVLIDAINQKQDTLPHEYAHHYIAWFRDTPIVQEAIKKWGSEEALVQSIGEQVVRQKGEAYNWWNNFVKWVMNQFNSLSKLQKEELTQILTDAFLTRQNLNLGSKQDIEGFKSFVKNSNKENNNIEIQLNIDFDVDKLSDDLNLDKDCK